MVEALAGEALAEEDKVDIGGEHLAADLLFAAHALHAGDLHAPRHDLGDDGLLVAFGDAQGNPVPHGNDAVIAFLDLCGELCA